MKGKRLGRKSFGLSGLTALLAAGALVLSGCGSSGGGEPANTGGTGGSSGNTASGGGGNALVVDGETIASASLYAAAKKEGSLTVYTAIPSGSDTLWKAITEDTGIKVTGLTLPTDKITQRILSEVSANTFPGDVISMPDRTLWVQFTDKNLLKSYTAPQEKNIPTQYQSGSTLYHARGLAANPLAYNTELVTNPPTSWADLLDPQYANRKVALKPITAGSVGWVEGLFSRAKFGLDYWKKLAAQKPSLQTSSSAVGQALGRGEVSVAVSRPGVIGDLESQGAPVKLVWPKEGTPMVVYYMGLVAKAKHPNAAKVFINWALSKRGQSEYAADVGDYAVDPNASVPQANGKDLPPLSQINPWIASTDQWNGQRQAWTQQWSKIFGYP